MPSTARWRWRGRPISIDRAGAVALVTAVCAPVLLLIVGFAADYGYASYINQRLAKATDAAVLASVSQTAATAAGGYGNTSFLQTRGTNVFNGNIAPLSLSGVKFNLSVVADGNGGVIATGSYSYASPTFFGGVIGKSAIPLAGNVQSVAHPITYVNYYILTDTSQSMGIASTQADMNELYSRVVDNKNASEPGQAGCIFGCHVKANLQGGGVQPYTNEDLAHNLTKTFKSFGISRVTLRIDSAVSAIQDVIAAAAGVAGTTKNIKFSLYTIQYNPNTKSYLSRVDGKLADPNSGQVADPPSSDYTALNTAAGTITLGDNDGSGIGDSDFVNELIAFNQQLSYNGVQQNGSGASASSPLNYFFIITDGLTDTSCHGGNSHCTSAFSTSNCDTLKKVGTVGVIYTTYLDIYDNNKAPTLEGNFVALVNPYKRPTDQITTSLQNCATSTDYFFPANDGPAISSAMQALFLKTQPTTARLTQ